MLMWKGRILLPSSTAASCPGRKLTALAAAAVARTSRRVGRVADMKFSFVGVSDAIDAVGGNNLRPRVRSGDGSRRNRESKRCCKGKGPGQASPTFNQM